MSMFSPAESSDIRSVIRSIVENKLRIQQLNEDNKEAIKGLHEKFKEDASKAEIATWVKWAMNTGKHHEDQEKLEEAIAKYEAIMSAKGTQPIMGEGPLELSDLD